MTGPFQDGADNLINLINSMKIIGIWLNGQGESEWMKSAFVFWRVGKPALRWVLSGLAMRDVPILAFIMGQEIPGSWQQGKPLPGRGDEDGQSVVIKQAVAVSLRDQLHGGDGRVSDSFASTRRKGLWLSAIRKSTSCCSLFLMKNSRSPGIICRGPAL